MFRSPKGRLKVATTTMVLLEVTVFALLQIAPWKATEFKPPIADQDWVLVLEAK